uniref:NADH dehydrogenase subunit 6 n=1 Tax=Pseudoceramium inkyui TaxID=196910 RepID=UPI002E77EE84|nr:NADH dehydrogenase subunit 6 [Pseudoceramium inkyui]WQF69627.1 NADH dehydrogenase subunit 6 [Pseudoceramium inkyui]
MINFDTFLLSTFSILGLFSAFLVISLKNAVHSVLFLVSCFFNFACLLLLLGAEFFSFLLIIVYVGAIAVLFLFVIMMLNIKFVPALSTYYAIIPLGFIVTFIFLFNFVSVLDSTDLLRFCTYNIEWISWFNEKNVKSNTIVIGQVLYSYFVFLFLLAGLILLIAMIGAIVLTMHYKNSSKAQVIELQVVRSAKDSVKFIKLRN